MKPTYELDEAKELLDELKQAGIAMLENIRQAREANSREATADYCHRAQTKAAALNQSLDDLELTLTVSPDEDTASGDGCRRDLCELRESVDDWACNKYEESCEYMAWRVCSVPVEPCQSSRMTAAECANAIDCEMDSIHAQANGRLV